MTLVLDIGIVDFERAVLTTEGEERRLRPLELRLLAYLAERPEVVVSPTDLLRDVWGYAAGVETRTIYATINRLRLALERDPANPVHILTVPRLGYRFRPRPPAVAPSGILGREEDIVRILAAIRAHRIVTVRGAAGVGKSRVVRELGLRGEPLVWCDLAHAESADDCSRVVVAALGVASAAAIGTRTGARLVLDDADHALDALRTLLPGWIGAGLGVVVTSRSALHIPAEVQVPIGPLGPVDAARLLQTRVQERAADVDVDVRNPEVQALVASLGGLPLAIELAAPWLVVRSAEELAATALPDLRDPHGGGGRHASIADSLRWTWSLLEPWARSALVQAATFAGPFDLRAARAVVRLDDMPVDEALLRLVERSWLRVEAGAAGQRFSFYAGQRGFLHGEASPGLVTEARERHTTFHAGLLAEQEPEHLYLLGGADWARLVARRIELRAALAHARGAERTAIARMLGRILLAVGPLPECLAVVEAAVVEPGIDPVSRLTLLQHRAIALRNVGRADAAREVLRDAIDAGGAYPQQRARLARALGVLELYHGDPGESRPWLEAARRDHEAVGATLEAAVVLAELGTLEFLHGSRVTATALLERALGPLRGAGTSWVYAVYLVNLAVLELFDGRVDGAERHLVEALALHRAAGAVRYEALALGNLALVEERRGRAAAAHAWLDEAFALTARTGDESQAGVLWSNRGLVHLGEGALDAAATALERAAGLAAAIPRLEVEVATRRARLHLALGELRRAEELATASMALAERLRFTTERREARLVAAEIVLVSGDPARAAALIELGDEPPTPAELALRGRIGAASSP